MLKKRVLIILITMSYVSAAVPITLPSWGKPFNTLSSIDWSPNKIARLLYKIQIFSLGGIFLYFMYEMAKVYSLTVLFNIKNKQDLLDRYATKKARLLVVFTGPACGPCVRYKKVLDTLDASLYTVVYASIFSTLAYEYRIEATPTTIFFYKGNLVATHEGALTQEKLQEKLNIYFSETPIPLIDVIPAPVSPGQGPAGSELVCDGDVCYVKPKKK